MSEDTRLTRQDLQYPRMRYIDAFPIKDSLEDGIGLRDPRQIAKNTLVVPPPVFFIISMFDGNHSLNDIQESITKQYNQTIPMDKIEEIVLQLDKELYLESETFAKALQKTLEAFRSAPYREPAHAGTAYPGEEDQINQQLSGLLSSIDGNSSDNDQPKSNSISLLIAPHIDLHRGGKCFAHAYHELAKHSPADLYIILGTGHQSTKSLISLTRKSYSNPIGLLETDQNFIDKLCQDSPIDLFEEELLHREEHSVEFQTLWLRHILPEEWNGKAVPILCGSFHSYVMNGESPRDDQKVARLLDKLRAEIHQYPGKVTVIAGVDLSHVGQKFGHEKGIPPEELKRVEQDDREVLDAIIQGDAENFYRVIEQKKDRNNVCGLSPIYMALDITRPSCGRLLNYDRAIEEDTQSVVTYASLAFYKT